ncbi:fluoride efflux transporter CrcB [Geodermatophilus sp. SYSU D00815]
MSWLWVGLGAVVGAPARHLADRWVRRRLGGALPWGTLAVNVVASFVLGVLAGAADAVSPALALGLGTGFCGALSTYSTFSHDTVRLVETGAWVRGLANVVVSLLAGLGAVVLGWAAGAAVL